MESKVLDARLQWPYTMIIGGTTGGGKSVFTSRLVKYNKEMMSTAPTRIIWCYGEYQSLYETMVDKTDPKVEFVKGLSPELVERKNLTGPTLLIVDDLADTVDGKFLASCFTRISHHRDISIILLLNNLYYRGLGHHMRDISLNAQYVVAFHSARDQGTILTLAKQMYGPKYRLLVDAYTDATTSHSYGYLMICCRANTPEPLKLRTRIFPGEENYCYIAKNG